MYTDFKEIGRRIAARRKELGLRQGYVNEAAGLSDKYLSNIENARSIPSIEVLMRICDVLNVTPDYFLVGAVDAADSGDYTKLMASKMQCLDSAKQKFLWDVADWLFERG